MLNYGPQNAWNQQLQSLVNQANALQNMQQVYNCIVDTK